jgi:hypothetical protein
MRKIGQIIHQFLKNLRCPTLKWRSEAGVAKPSKLLAGNGNKQVGKQASKCKQGTESLIKLSRKLSRSHATMTSRNTRSHTPNPQPSSCVLVLNTRVSGTY